MATKLDGLFTPGGRLVMGSLTSKQDKDFDNQPIPPEKQRYFFGLAVPKDAPGVGELIGQIYQMAAADYANAPLVMQQIQQGLGAKDFAWKIEDGDVPKYDKKTGQPKQTPDYIKGCFIFKFSTQFEIGACDDQGREINRADIKIGDYADIMFNTSINGKMDDTAGIYLNPVAIRRLGFGDAIASTVSASSAFANRAAERPAGASSMPTGGGAVPPATGGMPGMGNAPAHAAPAGNPHGMGDAGTAGQNAMPGAGQTGYPQQTPGNGMPGAAPTQPPAGAQGGMPGMGAGGQQPTQTASPTEPHTQILNGPSGGGMPGVN